MEDIIVGKISIPIIKGDKGDTGLQGIPGKDGINGYSPIKGVDYFTPDEIEDVTGEVTTRAKENLEYEFRENIKDISYDNTTGIMTFTRYDGTTVDVDLPLELIVSSGTYNDTTKEIELTLANGQVIKIPLSDLIDDFYIKSEIDQKVDTINRELTNLKTEDSKLQETLTNQATKIEELEEQNKQLLKDHKPIPFNSSSNHLVDTGELPMPISINGGIEQDSRVGYNELIEEFEVGSVFDGTYNNTNRLRNKKLVTVKANTDYTIKTNLDTSLFNFSYIISKATPPIIGGTAIVESPWLTAQKITINNVEDANLFIVIRKADNTDIIVNDIASYWFMVYEGTEEKPYEQYGAMPSLEFPSEVKGVSGHYDNVVENKQLFKKYTDTGSLTANGVEITNNADGSFTLNGTCTQNSWVEVVTAFQNGTVEQKTPKYLLNEEETYTFSLNKISGSVSNSAISAFLQANTSGSFGVSETKNQIQVKGNGVYRSWIYLAKDVVFNNYNFALQLEVGEVATDYTPHQEQLLPIDIPFNMYSGKPYKENGKWYRDVEFVKEILDGVNRLFVAKSGTTKNTLFMTNAFNQKIKAPATNDDKILSYSNCFNGDYSTNYLYQYDVKGLALRHDKVLSIGFGLDSEIDTVEKANAWLKEKNNEGNPVYMILPLAEPTREEITDTTLIEQLEALQKAKSYYEVTNINSYRATEDVAEMKLSGNALMSNDIRLSKLENAILSIGGNV